MSCYTFYINRYNLNRFKLVGTISNTRIYFIEALLKSKEPKYLNSNSKYNCSQNKNKLNYFPFTEICKK